jgi:hypothetical protein
MKISRFFLLFVLALTLFSAFLFPNCALLFPKPQSLERRLWVHANDIKRSDTSKINFKGVYIFSNQFFIGDSIRSTYGYYQFFRDGKFYQSRLYKDKRPTTEDTHHFDQGTWGVFYTQGNNIFFEYFSGYNGYYLRKAHFSENYNQLLFTGIRNSWGQTLKNVTSFATLEFLNN